MMNHPEVKNESMTVKAIMSQNQQWFTGTASK